MLNMTGLCEHGHEALPTWRGEHNRVPAFGPGEQAASEFLEGLAGSRSSSCILQHPRCPYGKVNPVSVFTSDKQSTFIELAYLCFFPLQSETSLSFRYHMICVVMMRRKTHQQQRKQT